MSLSLSETSFQCEVTGDPIQTSARDTPEPPSKKGRKKGKKKKSGKYRRDTIPSQQVCINNAKAMTGMKRAKVKGLRKKKKTRRECPPFLLAYHSLPTDIILAEPLPQASPD